MDEKNMMEMEMPTLTLDPFGEQAAAAAEAEAKEEKKVEPVDMADGLSEAEKKMVADFAEKIDITNANMVLSMVPMLRRRWPVSLKMPSVMSAPRIWAKWAICSAT